MSLCALFINVCKFQMRRLFIYMTRTCFYFVLFIVTLYYRQSISNINQKEVVRFFSAIRLNGHTKIQHSRIWKLYTIMSCHVTLLKILKNYWTTFCNLVHSAMCTFYHFDEYLIVDLPFCIIAVVRCRLR